MDHPITVTPVAGRVVVRWRGRTILDTIDAVELNEVECEPVLYLPRADADMRLMIRSARQTHCPFKGKANYFSLVDGRDLDANAIWTYENPLPGAEGIRGRLAFYLDKVEIERLER